MIKEDEIVSVVSIDAALFQKSETCLEIAFLSLLLPYWPLIVIHMREAEKCRLMAKHITASPLPRI